MVLKNSNARSTCLTQRAKRFLWKCIQIKKMLLAKIMCIKFQPRKKIHSHIINPLKTGVYNDNYSGALRATIIHTIGLGCFSFCLVYIYSKQTLKKLVCSFFIKVVQFITLLSKPLCLKYFRK
ncbi:serpin B6-like [Platysternon megacephalum]|uniref:Serpin B6-like n=1 Tax=Platysternon megacephalum TaxID=55544 RepID=A0A4D9EQC6_9SAUR|nr:serpin B6-like [Platysternon megacephalum]